MAKFNHGDICYTFDGGEVEYIASLGNGYAVREIRDTDEGPVVGDVIEVREVFSHPPREKYNKQIAELREEIEKLRTAQSELQAERRSMRESEAEKKARFMKHNALTRIDDFLAGKMTHLATLHWQGWRIMTMDQALKYKESEYDRVPNGIRLVTLFGKTNGDLEWQLSDYSSHENYPKKVQFFFSEEEVCAFVSSQLEIEYDLWRKDPKDWRKMESAVGNAKALGFEVPKDAEIAYNALEVDRLTAIRDKAKADYDKAEAELATGHENRKGN